MSYTYFIAENEGSEEFRIKIGFSKDPQKRIKTLQTGSSRKLEIMGWIESIDQSLERKLHRKYEQYRFIGEWFSIEPSDVLDELKSKSVSSYICIQANVGEFIGSDKDGAPEYLGPWQWSEIEIGEFCPQCGWGGGVHFNDALCAENCLRCGYPVY